MPTTKVLKYLIEKLREAGLITYDKEFLNYIGVSKDIVTSKQLHGFLARNGDIQKRVFLKSIEEFFEIPKAIWESSQERQKNLIDKAIEHQVFLKNSSNKDGFDMSRYIRTESPCSEEQRKQLQSFSSTNTQADMEDMIGDFLSKGLLNKRLENQAFLVELLHLCYDKGLYAIIIEFIEQKLYKRYYELTDVQKVLAHTYGSLGEYNEAQQILAMLEHHNNIESIDLKTSALSNHKREMFENPNDPIEPDKLYRLIEGYQALHRDKQIYSYYTGINLLYMVILRQILFPTDSRFSSIDAQKIYTLSKPSLKEDKIHHNYYATISSFEFHLLLNHEGVIERIESFLANKEPHPSLVERSARQMRLFISTIGNSNNHIVSLFRTSIEVLESYIKLKTC